MRAHACTHVVQGAFSRDTEPIGIDTRLAVSLHKTLCSKEAVLLAGARVSRVLTCTLCRNTLQSKYSLSTSFIPVRGEPRCSLLSCWMRFAHADLDTNVLPQPDMPHICLLGAVACSTARIGLTAQTIMSQARVLSFAFTSATSKCPDSEAEALNFQMQRLKITFTHIASLVHVHVIYQVHAVGLVSQCSCSKQAATKKQAHLIVGYVV
jgi:hypothetical protein